MSPRNPQACASLKEAFGPITSRVINMGVLTATNGEEALSLGDRYQGAIDLLLTDMVMPQMSGNLLAERFAALRPGARMLFMSGYADNAIIHHSRISLNSAFLQKPFSPIELANKVRDVLDR